LYRIYDQGNPLSGQSGTSVLTDYEFAEKLSYLTIGSMPDATLFAKAADGSLQTPEGVTAEVQRLLQLPQARPTIARFFQEWLQYDTLPDMSQFPDTALNGLNTNNLAANMTNDVDRTIQSIVFDHNGTFADLMSTRSAYVANNSLAQIYGISNPNGLTTLNTTRTGIFSRAAFLSKQPQYITSPVKRGRFLLTNVLCKQIGAPPPGAPAQPPPFGSGEFLTTRDRFNYLTVQDHNGQPVLNCVGCHGRMNPLGYTLEAFDSLGRYRNGIEVVMGNINGQPATENLPVNTQVTTNELDATNTSLADYIDLQQHLSQSDTALSCMSQQWFSFLEKRAVNVATDGCYMNEMLNTVYGTADTGQGSIQSMILSTILSQRFKYWKYQ
jgi:hypothetical protein